MSLLRAQRRVLRVLAATKAVVFRVQDALITVKKAETSGESVRGRVHSRPPMSPAPACLR
jgi:hypothetical protein